MTKRCIQLIRVSTSGQAAEDKASIPAQRAINQQTADAYGLTIVKTVELSDVSGAQVLLAPEIQEMLRLMNDPEIHGVIVREFSRLMRPENFSDYAMLQAFVDSGTLLYLPDGAIDFASDTGMLTGTMRAVMGGMERRELVKKMWRIKETKRREGGFSQSKVCLPFGVVYENGFSYATGSERVREAFRLVIAGETSYTSVANKVGIAAFNLRNILRNPIYTGWRVIDKRRDPSPKAKRVGANGRQADRPKITRAPEEVIRVRVIDEPLVSESDFNQVQRILDLKKQNSWRHIEGYEHRWTYNGYLNCTCGALIYTKCRRDDYYVCKDKCGVSYMRRDKLDPQLDTLFTKQFTKKRFLQSIVRGLNHKQPQANPERFNEQLKALDSKRDRILKSYFDGAIDIAERDKWLSGIVTERRVIAGMAARELPKPRVTVEGLAAVFAPFAEFDLLDRNDKRQLLNTLTPSIIAANYHVSGLWIASECVSDLDPVGVDTFRYDAAEAKYGQSRVYLCLRAA